LQEILLAIWVGSSPCEKYQVIKHKYFDGSKEVKDNIAKKEFEKTMSCLDPCKKATTSVPHPQSHTKKKPRMRFSIA
jgi:hypothetical protein